MKIKLLLCVALLSVVVSSLFGQEKENNDLSNHLITVGEYVGFLNQVAASSNVNDLYEATNKQITCRGVVNDYHYESMASQADTPILLLSWRNAAKYCDWKNASEKPSEKRKEVDDCYYDLQASSEVLEQVDQELKSNRLTFRMISTEAKAYQASGEEVGAMGTEVDGLMREVVVVGITLLGAGDRAGQAEIAEDRQSTHEQTKLYLEESNRRAQVEEAKPSLPRESWWRNYCCRSNNAVRYHTPPSSDALTPSAPPSEEATVENRTSNHSSKGILGYVNQANALAHQAMGAVEGGVRTAEEVAETMQQGVTLYGRITQLWNAYCCRSDSTAQSAPNSEKPRSTNISENREASEVTHTSQQAITATPVSSSDQGNPHIINNNISVINRIFTTSSKPVSYQNRPKNRGISQQSPRKASQKTEKKDPSLLKERKQPEEVKESEESRPTIEKGATATVEPRTTETETRAAHKERQRPDAEAQQYQGGLEEGLKVAEENRPTVEKGATATVESRITHTETRATQKETPTPDAGIQVMSLTKLVPSYQRRGYINRLQQELRKARKKALIDVEERRRLEEGLKMAEEDRATLEKEAKAQVTNLRQEKEVAEIKIQIEELRRLAFESKTKEDALSRFKQLKYTQNNCLNDAIEYLNNAIIAISSNNAESTTLWKEAAVHSRQAAEEFQEVAQMSLQGSKNRVRDLDSFAYSSLMEARNRKYLAKESEAKVIEKLELAQKWREVAVQNQQASEHFERSADACFDYFYIAEKVAVNSSNAGHSFRNTAEKLVKGIEAEEARKPAVAKAWRRAALLQQQSGEFYEQAVKAYAKRKDNEALSWHNAGNGFYHVAEKLEEAIKAKEVRKSAVAKAWCRAALLQQQSVKFYKKAAKTYVAGKEKEGVSWNNVGHGFYSAAEKLGRGIKAEEAEKPAIAKAWREAAEKQQGSVEFYRKAAEAYAAGQKKKGLRWNNAGQGIYRAAEKLGKAIEATEAEQPAIAQAWRTAAEKYEEAHDFWKRTIKAIEAQEWFTGEDEAKAAIAAAEKASQEAERLANTQR